MNYDRVDRISIIHMIIYQNDLANWLNKHFKDS